MMRILRLQRTGWRPAARSFTQCRYTHAHKHVEFSAIDAKWRERWNNPKFKELWKHDANKEKAYILPMFPYPSGTLHLGHLRVYTISDVLARVKRMQGYQVIHPIGWDAFGLPAENAAFERGVAPEQWTLQNIEAMKKQMGIMGGQWDWDREIRTCDPAFYKHTQAIFIELFKRGLAYQAEALVNYDPVDRTVLANEQVDANGCSWRSGAKVEQVMLKQWFLKIKEFQKPLLEDLDTLAADGMWPERVIAQQKNWLGRSEGTKLWFEVQGGNGVDHAYEPIEVFTTRADTLFGVQFLAISLDHPIATRLAEQHESLRAWLTQAKALPPDSKEGYLLKDIKARNPMSHIMDDYSSKIPIYVAPYVLSDYGSGAVMGVPGHDARDFAFWRENACDATVRQVVSASPEPSKSATAADEAAQELFQDKGFISANIAGFHGMSSDEAIEEIVARLKEAGKPAEKTENWRLRDWLISRQRYWGTPIPIVHCKSCGPVPVPQHDLPVALPTLSEKDFVDRNGNPLENHPNWKHTACPDCGSPAERETDTMDTFMDSSWYFFRFLSPHLETNAFSPDAADKLMPVDIYIGGVEHAILHLLYARFIAKVLASTRSWPKGKAVQGEPFKRLITQGMVHGKTYTHPDTGRFLKPEEVDASKPSAPVIRETGATPRVSFEKMSKSKYNGVDPETTIRQHGADVTRAHMLFQAPVSDVLEWDETKITGVERWLTRIIKTINAAWMSPNVVKAYAPEENIDASLVEILDTLHKRGTLKLNHQKPNMGEAPEKQDEVSPKDSYLPTLKPEDKEFWLGVQKIVMSVTQSYNETYSLNTIISDLMTLTNLIWDTKHESDTLCYLKYHATIHLLRMLAPVAPAVAEEAWEALHTHINRGLQSSVDHDKGVESIFTFGFPKADTEIMPFLQTRVTCVFQVDGRKKFEAEIPLIDSQKDQQAINEQVFEHLLETEQGKEWLTTGNGKLWALVGQTDPDPNNQRIPRGCRAVVVKAGKLVNIVSPKKPKEKKGSAS